MDHERRDVDLKRVVEVLQEAAAAGDLRHLHPLLSADVVLETCEGLVLGPEAVVRAIERWAEALGRDWEVVEVVDGGDRMAVRYQRGDHQGALFLKADADGRVATAIVTPSAA